VDKKGLAVTLLERASRANGKAPSHAASEPDGSDGADAGKVSAIEDLIAAVHAKDTTAALEAFESLLDMC
jgi:hypothetical protein